MTKLPNRQIIPILAVLFRVMGYVENYNIEEQQWLAEQEAEAMSKEQNTFLDWLQLAKQEDFSRKYKIRHQQDLITSFIKTDPKIQPVKGALQSIEIDLDNRHDKEESVQLIVSETLAKVYHEQKKYPLAIETYQKLRLVYPEKSSYFASLIKKLEKELREGKA